MLEEIKKANEHARLVRDKWAEISLWAIILFLALCLFGCGGSGGSSSVRQPPLPTPGNWYNFGENGANYILMGPTFAFPQQSQNQVIGYVYQAPPAGNIMGKTITLDYTVTLDGALGVADPKDTLPASLTLFLWEKGDTLSAATPGYQYYRWWCPTRGALGNGEHTLSCVVGNSWTDVAGTPVVGSPQDPNSVAGFNQALNNLFGIGFTCGGANYYGHGCWTTGGTVTFKINNFTVQ